MADEITAKELLRNTLAFVRDPPGDALEEVKGCKTDLDAHLDNIHQRLSSIIEAVAISPPVGESAPFEGLNYIVDVIRTNKEKIAKAWKLSVIIESSLSRHLTVGGYGMSKVALHEEIVNAREKIAAEIGLDVDVEELIGVIEGVLGRIDGMKGKTVQVEQRKLHDELAILDTVKELRGHFKVIKDFVGKTEQGHDLNRLRNSLQAIEQRLSNK